MVREAYLSGETAGSVAERFDVTVSAMRRRMRHEGWTRRDYAAAIEPMGPRRKPGPSTPRLDASPTDEPPQPPPLPPASEPAGPPRGMTADEVARWAVREAGQALAEGRPDAAHRAVRTAETLVRLLKEHPDLDPERRLPKNELRTLFREDRTVIEELAEEYGITEAEAAAVEWEAYVRKDGSLGARPPLASWLPGARAESDG